MTMETEIVAVNPAEYGLKKEQTESITLAFVPNIEERKLLTKQYTEMLSKEMSREVAIDAGKLRRKLVKVRTGLAKIHKVQKAFFLAAGRFVDAHKNKETEPVTQMEAKLLEMEDYYINLEKTRIAELHTKRHAEIKDYIDSENLRNFGELSDDDYADYYRRAKKNFDDLKKLAKQEKEAEDKRIMAEAAEKVKLKKEREKAENEAKAEKKKREKVEDDLQRTRSELRVEKAKHEAVEYEKVAQEQVAINEETLTPDSVKLESLIKDIEDLKEKYVFKVDKNKKTYENVGKLFDKIALYIKGR